MRKITIEPVTRIEGHAKISIYLNEQGEVDHSYLHINEFRGFEKFCEGRMFFEMPSITPRICGICPVSHHLAAAKAGDQIVGAEPPRTAKLLRELMHMGQVIQSHGMHFFELAGPDLLLGFDAAPEQRNVVGLIQANPELALRAVRLRKFGQEIIKTLGGRKVHPNFAVPGGVNQPLSARGRDDILSGYAEALETTRQGIAIIRQWAERHQEDIEKFAVFPTGYMGLVTPQGGLELYDGDIRLINPSGELWEQFPPEDYLDYIAERVEPWSFLKFPYYKKLGYPQGAYRVGALARLNLASDISTPLAREEWQRFRALSPNKPVENTLHYHYARLIEVLFALERVHVLLDDPDILGTDILNTHRDMQPRGVGILEAPRGTLFHDYRVLPNGQLKSVNLIVATGNNNWAMSAAVNSVAKTYIHNGEVSEGLLNRVEAAVRAYDPCLSCSTHAIGQMPILVNIFAPDGKLHVEVRRDAP